MVSGGWMKPVNVTQGSNSRVKKRSLLMNPKQTIRAVSLIWSTSEAGEHLPTRLKTSGISFLLLLFLSLCSEKPTALFPRVSLDVIINKIFFYLSFLYELFLERHGQSNHSLPCQRVCTDVVSVKVFDL